MLNQQKIVLLIGGIVLFLVFLFLLNRKPKTPNVAPLPAPTGWEGQVASLTNVERSTRGLPQLVYDAKLAEIARLHSADMNNRNFFDHKNPSGEDPGARATKAGYKWGAIGENIAAGQPSPDVVMKGWMNSPGHRSNILGNSYKRIGVGIVRKGDGQGTPVYTQMFSD